MLLLLLLQSLHLDTFILLTVRVGLWSPWVSDYARILLFEAVSVPQTLIIFNRHRYLIRLHQIRIQTLIIAAGAITHF